MKLDGPVLLYGITATYRHSHDLGLNYHLKKHKQESIVPSSHNEVLFKVVNLFREVLLFKGGTPLQGGAPLHMDAPLQGDVPLQGDAPP